LGKLGGHEWGEKKGVVGKRTVWALIVHWGREIWEPGLTFKRDQEKDQANWSREASWDCHGDPVLCSSNPDRSGEELLRPRPAAGRPTQAGVQGKRTVEMGCVEQGINSVTFTLIGKRRATLGCYEKEPRRHKRKGVKTGRYPETEGTMRTASVSGKVGSPLRSPPTSGGKTNTQEMRPAY